MILEPRWKSYIVATAEPVLTPKQCNELITIGRTEPKINSITIKEIPEFKNKIIAINKLVIAKPKIIIGNLPILSERKPSTGVKTIPAIVNNAR